jgi:hypothetical protein
MWHSCVKDAAILSSQQREKTREGATSNIRLFAKVAAGGIFSTFGLMHRSSTFILFQLPPNYAYGEG